MHNQKKRAAPSKTRPSTTNEPESTTARWMGAIQSDSQPSEPEPTGDTTSELVWAMFASAALTPLVAEQTATSGPEASRWACKELARQAGAYANAMLAVWGDEWGGEL